ncbi:MAG: DUF1521 domain-containing protein [Phycisphaerae bacterium]
MTQMNPALDGRQLVAQGFNLLSGLANTSPIAARPALFAQLNTMLGKVLGGAKLSALDQLGRYPGILPFPRHPRPWPFPFPMPRPPFRPEGRCGCRCCPSDQSASGLTTKGNTVDTGRYRITVQEGRVKIYDKQTNTWVKAHGDPHLLTSDGDKGQFHENLTIDLPDGTKVTIKCTQKDARGIAYIDAVAVMKGEEAVVISGVHDGRPGVNVGNVLNNADAVDRMWADGTVMRAGREVDDLTFARDGKELVGIDPNARWQEHNLDGHGGVSRNRPDRRCGNGESSRTNGTSGTSRSSNVSGGSIWARLWAIIAQLQDKLEAQVKELEDKTAQLDSNAKGTKVDQELQQAFFQIQRLQDSIKQMISTMTNLQKADSDSKMAIARNLA